MSDNTNLFKNRLDMLMTTTALSSLFSLLNVHSTLLCICICIYIDNMNLDWTQNQINAEWGRKLDT